MTPNELTRRCNNAESFIVANDGQYLGKLSLNRFDPESILNNYGLYGSQYSVTSIYNKYSMYGSQYSSLSPFNPFTSTPPHIYLKGVRVGVLSVNRYIMGSVDPEHIQIWMKINNLYI